MIDFKATAPGYVRCGDCGPTGARWRRWDDTTIILTTAPHDGQEWAHLSVAHSSRLPRYRDLVEAKGVFLGKEAKAIMVFPPQSEHVNIHPNCLHLYCRLDGDSLPDFTMEIFGRKSI